MIIVILAFSAMVVWQMPKLIKERRWRELKYFSIFLFVGFVLNVLLAMGVELPDPTKGIQIFFDTIKLHY
ncbi:MAG: hypothetical protein PHO15_07125 [Eubacteriales bacterium]|nr:hypothetical protein [Eubacteriales bacterium]